jgi:hypothetical protein
MWDNKGRRWREDAYAGDGKFGGKDYYELLSEMNDLYDYDEGFENRRSNGLRLFGVNGVLHPNLTHSSKWEWRNARPRKCPNRGMSDNSINYYDDYDSDYEGHRGNSKDYHKQDAPDNWKNGEVEPVVPSESKPPMDWFEPESVDSPAFDYGIIEHNYSVVSFNGGEMDFDDVERVYKNPLWVVKDKDHKNKVYDTTFVIMYCEGGYYVKMSVENYNRIQEFCSNNKEELLLYVEGETLKGHCRHPAHMEKAKEVLEPIWNKETSVWLMKNTTTRSLERVPSESMMATYM